MFRKLALTALVLAGCTLDHAPVGSQSSAIIGGTEDPTGDPSVVMIYAQITDGDMASGAICTGEAVSPHMVLTAAHCVDPAVINPSGKGTIEFIIYLGDSLGDDMALATEGNLRAVLSTDYDHAFDSQNLPGGHDVGWLVTKTVIPRPVLPVHQTPLTSANVGDKIHIVGYGIDNGTDSTGASAGVKRQTDTTIKGISEPTFTYGTAAHTTCEGDSGGPALEMINGVQTIVGTVSYSIQGCGSGWTDTDVGAFQSEIATAMTNAEAEAAAQDMTPEPADLAGSSSTQDLAAGGGSSGGGNDAGATGGSSGLALGNPCQTSAECASGICTLGSSHYCTQACELNVDTSCPQSMMCEEVGGAPYCVIPTKSSGCSATAGSAPGSSGALGGIILLLAVALGLRFVPRRP